MGHGTENVAETSNGIDLTGATNVAVISSYLNDFKCIAGVGGTCTDAHALDGGDDSAGLPEGTWKVYNDFIEASGENILFGGDAKGTSTPKDLEIRMNHLYKVPFWNPRDPDYVQPYPGFNGYIVKNIFELKNAQRVLFEGNRMEYSWGGTRNKVLRSCLLHAVHGRTWTTSQLDTTTSATWGRFQCATAVAQQVLLIPQCLMVLAPSPTRQCRQVELARQSRRRRKRNLLPRHRIDGTGIERVHGQCALE